MNALRQFFVRGAGAAGGAGAAFCCRGEPPPPLPPQVRKEESEALERFVAAMPGGASKVIKYTTSNMT